MRKTLPTLLECSLSALRSCALTSLVLVAGGTAADDTEVFFAQTSIDADTRPNVLFVLDTSGSMNHTAPNSSETKIDQLKDAMDEILNSSQNINVGLMRFNGVLGGGAVIEPITPIDKTICNTTQCSGVEIATPSSGQSANAEERLSNGQVSLDDFALDLGVTDHVVGRPQIVGLSFDTVNVPSGARITSAEIEFTAEADDIGPSSLTIAAEAADDAATYTDADGELSGRATAGSVSWTPGPWSSSSVYSSPDIKELVQAITDRPGWCGGNTLNLQIRGSGSRRAMSVRRGASYAPTLKVSYDASNIEAGGGCVRETLVVPVATDADDTEERYPNGGSVVNGYDYASVPRVSNGATKSRNDDTVVGLRFRDLALPRDAVIEQAWISMRAYRPSDSTDVVSRIDVQDSDDAPPFSTSRYGVSSLPRTSAVALWDMAQVSASGDAMRSSDVADLVSDIVGRSGWESGNAIAFLFRPHSGNGYREFSYRDHGYPPKLHVEYRANILDGATSRTARDDMQVSVDNIQAHDGTPIVGALYEAAQYFRGGSVDFGRSRGLLGDRWYDSDADIPENSIASESRPTGSWSATALDNRSRFHRTSHPDSWTGGTLDSDCPADDSSDPTCTDETITGDAVYDSPMLGSCQSNYIVLLSDGAPFGNGAARRVESLTGADCFGDGAVAEECGTELVDWLRYTDHDPLVYGTQGVRTYTVGFGLGAASTGTSFLESLSSAGGGRHFSASQTTELVSSFEEIIAEVQKVDTAFVSPGATVNQFNRLTHRDDIYFALFKPDSRVRWAGNLKRYKVVDSDGAIVIRDVNGLDAVDESAGFFSARAQSFWSEGIDGAEVRLGGMTSVLELGADAASARKVYTYTGALPIDGPIDLTLPEHALSETNDDIEDAMLGIVGESAAYRETLLKWARGVDVEDVDGDGSTEDIRHEMGDPMHSQPVILNYGDSPSGNETTVFISTNQGFLHALDPEVTTGTDVPDTEIDAKELFSWIPQSLLPNLDVYYENAVSNAHPYGLDGQMSVWIDDKDNDLTVDSDESAYLFVGMRRGGRNYYALDVSDRDSPKLAWSIEGGSADFPLLGQSWSRAVPTRMQIDGVQKDVLVFTGGYNTNQDAGELDADPDSSRFGKVAARSVDSYGAGLYVVDLKSGDLLWSGTGTLDGDETFADMNYSMPGSPELLDVDVDGLVDQIYASDTGGQVWRFDVTPYHVATDDKLIDGGVMARLGGNGDDAEARRFYYEPDVSLIEQDGKRFVSIAIGSGWRAHPLNRDVEDRFYVLRSDAVYAAPDGYGRFEEGIGGIGGTWSPITDADLQSADDLTLDIGVDGYGWYKSLEASGEKVISSSLTVNNQVTFTTYLPDQRVAACSTAIGSGAVYVLDIVSGRASTDMDGDGDIDENDDSRMLAHPGLPPPVVAIITAENEGGLIGSEQQDLDFGLLTQRTYWRDLSDTPDRADLDDVLDD